MGAAVAEGAQTVSRAAEYRKRMLKTVTLDASGMEVKVRAGSMVTFVYGGSLPAPMLGLVTELQAGKPMNKSGEPDLARLMDLVLVHYVVDPALVAPVETGGEGEPGKPPVYHYALPALKDGELGTWELLDSDKFQLFALAMSDTGFGAATADSFRPVPTQSDASDGPGPVGAEVSPEAK